MKAASRHKHRRKDKSGSKVTRNKPTIAKRRLPDESCFSQATEPVYPKIDDLVHDQFKLLRELGRGTFGAVYEAHNIRNQTFCAVKVETRKKPKDNLSFAVELKVLKLLARAEAKNTSVLIANGEMPFYGYIVMPIVGTNIESLLDSLKKQLDEKTATRFSLHTAVHLAVGCLQGLEELHNIRYIHRDVKPQNFAIGRPPNANKVYLLDFGLAREYARPDGTHHRPRARVGFRGTVMYASVMALNNHEQSRRDDMWSWLFTVLRFTAGSMPWSKLEQTENQTYKDQQAAYAKCKTDALKNPEKLFQDCPTEFINIYVMINALDYYDQPNYAEIARILNACRSRVYKGKALPPLDWEMLEPSSHLESFSQVHTNSHTISRSQET